MEFDELFGCRFERFWTGPWRDEDFDIEVGADNLLYDVADGKDRDITGLFGGSGFFGTPGEDDAQQGDTVYEGLSHASFIFGSCRFSGMDACNPSAKIGKKVKFVPIDLRLSVPWIHIWGRFVTFSGCIGHACGSHVVAFRFFRPYYAAVLDFSVYFRTPDRSRRMLYGAVLPELLSELRKNGLPINNR